MSKSLPAFSLITKEAIVRPCLTLGDESFFYSVSDDFNKWFFSKVGYLLINNYSNILIDKILFTLLGGSDTWLSLSSKKITIKNFKTDNYLYTNFITAISAKILLSQGFNPAYSDWFEGLIIPPGFNQVLLFYYTKYHKNLLNNYSNSNIPSLKQAIESSKNHDGLYTIVRVDNNIYYKGNTLHFDQRPKAVDSLFLVYFFAKLFENIEIRNTVQSCIQKKSISADDQIKIEIFIKQMDK